MSRRKTIRSLAFVSGTAAALSILMMTALAAQTAITADGAIESTSGGFIFPDGSLQATAASPGFAPIEDSGQQNCWDSAANPINCADTGQDGESQAGVTWPTPRFDLNGDGTVTDNLTGLDWLQDAGCLGPFNWDDALAAVEDLNNGLTTCTNYTAGTFDDWRLANIKELLSLMDYGQTGPPLPPGNPFLGVQGEFYWSSTTVKGIPSFAWGVFMDQGSGANQGKVIPPSPTDRYGWPVRGGS